MDKTVNLTAGDYCLSLETANESNWCKVYYKDLRENTSVYLGADCPEVICSRLYSALKMEKISEKRISRLGVMDLFWILSLAEAHASIYGSITDTSCIQIYCAEDGENGAKFLPVIRLEKQDAADWISALEEYIGELSRSSSKGALPVYFSDEDRELIEALSYNKKLKPGFEIIKSSLIWRDEVPALGYGIPERALSSDGCDKLYDLCIARTVNYHWPSINFRPNWWIHDEEGRNLYKLAWEVAIESGVKWPGFEKKRLHLSWADKRYLRKELKRPIDE